jgi:hypothetical protein
MYTEGRHLLGYDKLCIALQYYEKRRSIGAPQNASADDIGLSQRTLGSYLHGLDSYISDKMMILHSRGGSP